MSIASDLRVLLGNDSYVIDDPEILISYQRDQAPFAKAEMPAAVLIAKTIDVTANPTPEPEAPPPTPVIVQ